MIVPPCLVSLPRLKKIVLIAVTLSIATTLHAQNDNNASLDDSTDSLVVDKKAHYLNSQDINYDILSAIPQPPVSNAEDFHVSQEAIVSSSEEQLNEAKQEPDNIFSYSSILGSKFNSEKLPKTAALFKKVDKDIDIALHTAKDTFQRQGPHHGKYSYPSQHSAKAVFWAALLSDIYPNKKDLLTNKALQKSWNRVILGLHYPADTYAGGVCGIYLKQLFLTKPAFKLEWNNACAEIRSTIPSTMN